MFDSTPPSIRMQRSQGAAHVVMGPRGLIDLAQRGSAKAMLPRMTTGLPEIVFLNTAGGLASGDGLSFGVELRAGRALGYRNRWVRTPRLEEQLGLPAAPQSPHAPYPQGSGAVNVIRHAGKILALGEVGLPYAMTRELDTVGQHDFGEQLRSAMTAHPKIDPITGELFFFGYDFGEVPLRYHVADAQSTFLIMQDSTLHWTLHAVLDDDAAMAPQFESTIGVPVKYEMLYVGEWKQNLLLAGLFWSLSLLWYVLVIALVGRVATVLRSPAFARTTEGVAAAGLTGFGGYVLIGAATA